MAETRRNLLEKFAVGESSSLVWLCSRKPSRKRQSDEIFEGGNLTNALRVAVFHTANPRLECSAYRTCLTVLSSAVSNTSLDKPGQAPYPRRSRYRIHHS